MKKISILLAILAWATMSYAWTSKTEYRNASGDVSYVYPDATTGNILIQNPDDEEGYAPLRTPDIGVSGGVQAHSDNLDEYAAVNPVADALTRLTLSNAELGEALGTTKYTQTVSVNNEGTLTPTSGYDYVRILLTPNASPTYITFEEPTTQAETGDEIEIFNVDENYGIFEDTPGKLELPGRTTLKQGGKIKATYIVDRYYGFPSGAMEEYASAINLTGGGIIQGGKKIITATGDVNLTYDQLGGSELRLSGAGPKKVTIQDSPYIVTGEHFTISREGTGATEVRSLNASHYFRLPAGTDLDAADVVDLDAGTDATAEFTYMGSNKWRVLDLIGTSLDGGVPAGGAGTYLTDGDVIAAWYFENNLEDATAENNDLTDHGTITFVSTPPAPQGSYWADFNGTTQYASSTDVDFETTLTDTSWSLFGRVYFDTDHAGVIASMGGTDGNRGWVLYRHLANNSFYLQLSTNGSTLTVGEQTATDTAPIETELSFALVFDGTNIRFYINGYESTNAGFPVAFSSTAYDTTANFELGHGYIALTDNNRYLNGKLDQVYLISRALTSEEVLDIYMNGLE